MKCSWFLDQNKEDFSRRDTERRITEELVTVVECEKWMEVEGREERVLIKSSEKPENRRVGP